MARRTRSGWEHSALPTVVIGRDPRPSGSWAGEVAARSIEAHGVQTILLGVVPTPTAQYEVTHRRASGGLVISGSHNSAEWNALKFLGRDGVFLSDGEMRMLHGLALDAMTRAAAVSEVAASGRVADDGAIGRHIANVLTALPIDAENIRARKFRVVVDPVNGAGALALPRLLEALGCAVTCINGEATGLFAHAPEPTPEHLTDLSEAVRAAGADLGVAVDPDADRLALVDEQGNVLSEEYTVTLAALAVLDRLPEARRSPVVVNLSTTRMVEDVARRFGTTVVRTPVGERHVVEGMREHGAVIGGEGNGGVILPASHEGRDSLVGATLVLDLLARRAVTLSALRTGLPQYVMRKEKLPKGETWDQAAVVDRLSGTFPDAVISTLDGVRADTVGGWVHLRPSNTEPIIRLIGEAQTTDALHQLLQAVRAAILVPAEPIS